MRYNIRSTIRKAFQIKIILFLTLFMLVGISYAGIQQEYLQHPKAKNKYIELYWGKPLGTGPWPAILFIHGHQFKRKRGGRIGGKRYVDVGRLDRMMARGYVAAAISQPGYGNSSGPPDYCGPFTQDAVLEAIKFLREKPFVQSDKIALYGYSRGAIVSSMVATKDQGLAAVILGAGVYDIASYYPTNSSKRNKHIEQEAGTTPEAFRARSAISHVDKIRSPILILHGADDEHGTLPQAKTLAKKLKANGIPVKIKVFPDTGHIIPVSKQYEEIHPFLDKYLGLIKAVAPVGTTVKKEQPFPKIAKKPEWWNGYSWNFNYKKPGYSAGGSSRVRRGSGRTTILRTEFSHEGYSDDGKKYYVVKISSRTTFHLTPELNRIAVYRYGKLHKSFVPEQRVFDWPLYVGKEWIAPYTRIKEREGERDEEEREGRFKVVNIEEIKTPTGTFKAFKIVEYNGEDVQSIHWFAPKVKWLVKRETLVGSRYRYNEWLLAGYYFSR